MTQNDKDLLLRDLCARLPYGIKCEVIKYDSDGEMVFIRNGSGALELTIDNVKELVTNNLYKTKPYLFPLSSMTEEQKKEYDSIIYHNVELHWERYYDVIDVDWYEVLHDFYNKNHFDYRGFIPMGLAIDATDKNIY